METRTPLQPTKAHRTVTPRSTAQPPASEQACSQCAIASGVPSFKSFSHIRDPKARRAKEYEQQLLLLRDLFPEYSTGIDSQIEFARSQAGRTPVSDRDRVTAALEAWPGGVTCGEVSEDLKIPYKTAYKILREFLESGFVAATERRGLAGNKPYLVFTLAH